MRKRVLIAMHYLELGGAETALIGLLRAWDYNVADVDLFLYSHRGELMRYVPAEVNLLPERKVYTLYESPAKDVIKSGRLDIAFARWKARKEFKSFLNTHRQPNHDAAIGYIGHYVTPFLPHISSRTYDLAISFLAPHDIVLHKVKARRKACWIHTDYTAVGHDAGLEHPVWAAYDNIVSISPDVTRSFCKIHPGLEDKIIEIGNILSPDIVRGRADEFIPTEYDATKFNMLSIGRFTDQKNFDNLPFIMRSLIEKSGRDDLMWYIIGYGGGERVIRDAIHRAGMERNVHIIGKRENPYPYIKHCDLYVQPSRFEGRSVTVREAQMLGRPVVITNYRTASSQIEDGVDGIIAPMANDKCASVLADVIADGDLQNTLSANCLSRDYSDSSEINKIYSIIP